MSSKLNDIIKLSTNNHLKDVKEVQMLVSCELMKTHLKASPIEPNKDIIVTQDANGHAMIFTIGTDGIFRLIRFNNGHTDEYTVIDLMKNFNGYEKAVTFDLSEGNNKKISIAIVLTKKDVTSTDIFVAMDIDLEKSDFNGIFSKVNGIAPDFEADHIHVGSTDVNQHAMVIIAGKEKGREFYYLVNDVELKASKHEFPENPEKETQIEVGYKEGENAYFFLYTYGNSTTLTSKAGIQHYDYSPNGVRNIPEHTRYNCMALGAGSDKDTDDLSSDLYVGANNGVYLFKSGKKEDGGFQLVTDAITEVHQLYVAEDDHGIALWAVTSPSNLYYIYGKKNEDKYQWNYPILFNERITHLAPIRNNKMKSNELYLIDQGDNLVHCWQDRHSTLWNQRTINIRKEAYLMDVDSFTTQVKFADQDGKPLIGKAFTLTSSEWMYVRVNGSIYSIDASNPATITTDLRGIISIVQLTENIASPIFHLEADFLEKTVNIFPNGKIQEGLAHIKSGNDLENAEDLNKKKVITGSHSKDTLASVAGTLQTLIQVSKVEKKGVFISLTNKSHKETHKLSLEHIPEKFAVGMTFKNGAWQSHITNEGFIKAGGGILDIATVIGDGFVFIENTFDKGVNTVKEGAKFVFQKVEQALHFVFNIGGKVLNLVLDTAQKVYTAINWVLKQVGIGLREVMRWLGHVLDLDEVWKTHEVIVQLMTNAITFGTEIIDAKVAKIKDQISKTLDGVKHTVAEAVLPDDIAKEGLNRSELFDHPLNSSAGSWIFSQIFHNGLLGGSSLASSGKLADSDPVQKLIKAMEDGLNVLMQKLEVFFQHTTDLLTKNIKNVYKLILDLLDVVVDPIKQIISDILDLSKDLVGNIKSLLESKLELPFLEKMFKLFAKVLNIDIKEKLTITNVVAFIIAIPYTYVVKFITGKAPFATDNDLGMKRTSYFKDLFAPKVTDFVVAGSVSPAIYYSRIGGGIASIAAIPEGILSLLSLTVNDNGQSENLKKISAGLSWLITVLTFPIEQKGQNEDAYNLRLSSWVISSMKSLLQVNFKLEKEKAVFQAACDSATMCLAMPANILGQEGPLSFAKDILSNMGGGATALMGTAKQPEGAAVGAALSYLGAGISFAECVSTNKIVHTVNPGG